MIRIITILSIVLSSSIVWSGENITAKDLEKLRQQTQNESFKVKQNIITNNSLNSLAIQRDHIQRMDRNFTHIIKRGIPTNQKRSGRCWLFAGFNVVRYYTEKTLGVKHFEFSENYLFFFHKLELANYLLNETVFKNKNLNSYEVAWLMRNGLGDGGYWDMFTALLNKYGAVPKSAMPETAHSSNTRQLNDLFNRLVKKHVAILLELRDQGATKNVLYVQKDVALSEIYTFLSLTLGTPPESFEWRYTKNGKVTNYVRTTPMQFYDKYVKSIVSNKIHLMSDPALSYNKLYILEGVKNVTERNEGPFLNVPAKVLETATKQSILKGHPVWFGADVGKYSDIKQGLLDTNYFNYTGLFGMEIEGDKAQRLRTYASAATHAMVIFGMDLVQGQPHKWLIENSWGTGGKEGGYLIMTNGWMKEYVFDIIVDRKFIPYSVKKSLSGEVIELPSWHHLWKKPLN